MHEVGGYCGNVISTEKKFKLHSKETVVNKTESERERERRMCVCVCVWQNGKVGEAQTSWKGDREGERVKRGKSLKWEERWRCDDIIAAFLSDNGENDNIAALSFAGAPTSCF